MNAFAITVLVHIYTILITFGISISACHDPSYSYLNKNASTLKTTFENDGFITGIKIFESDEMKYYLNELAKLETKVEEGKFVGQEINPHLQYKFLWDIATHPKILSILSTIFSDDFALLATTLFTKYPDNGGKYVGYHQDVYYWGLKPPEAINVWFAFDEVSTDSGPMIYIPKSHTHNYQHQIMNNKNNLLIGRQEIPKDLFNESNGVEAILKSGYIAIHHGKLVHGSSPNLSGKRRCGFVMRYMDLNTEIIELEYHNKDKILQWRTPRIICGETDKNVEQFYPHPNFVENPEIPKRISWKERYYFANRCTVDQDQCTET